MLHIACLEITGICSNTFKGMHEKIKEKKVHCHQLMVSGFNLSLHKKRDAKK